MVFYRLKYLKKMFLKFQIIQETEEIEVNLQKQLIYFGNKTVNFELDEFKKKCLLEGLDDIALSLEKIKHIEKFEQQLNTTGNLGFN